MPSSENDQVLKMWEGFMASLAPKADGTPPGLPDLRGGLAALCAGIEVPAGADVRPVELGGVPALSVQGAGSGSERTILYFHGGGYVMGAADDSRSVGALLSTSADARVLLVDYRVAPEHPFPAAVDDAVAVYRALLDDGVAPSSVAFCGESAGGGLTLAALLAVRDAGLPVPAAGIAFSPWADLTLTAPSLQERAGRDPVISAPVLSMLAPLYLSGADASTPLASPLLGDLAGLPPLLLLVGTEEVLWDDTQRLADRARAAGVDVTVEVGEGMFHVWPIFAAMLPEGQAALAQAGRFVDAHVSARGGVTA